MQIYDILIKKVYNFFSKSDRIVFALSHIVIFSVKYYQRLKNIHDTSKTQSTHKAITCRNG